jgi:thymidine kinase
MNKENASMEIITGCMFSGKTKELIKRMKLAKDQGQSIKVFKPMIDNRYHQNHLVSHDSEYLESLVIERPIEIMNHIENPTIIGIDEFQFFDESIVEVCKKLIKLNCKVIISGLDYDFTGNPFGYMHKLLAYAKSITTLSAICCCCGKKANYTYKKKDSITIIEIGEKELYEARCSDCFQKRI